MLENYEINTNTIAIIPLNSNLSKVIEEDMEYEVCKSTTEIINHSCKYFGSSFIGRKEGTKALMGISYKAPIIVEETKNIIFFPTSSPRFDNCTWISLRHVNNYLKNEQNSLISFKNGGKLELNISYGSLENQVLRATRLESILRHRKFL